MGVGHEVGGMEVDIRTYGDVRDAAGQKTLTREVAPGSTVGTLLADMDAEFDGFALEAEFERGAVLVMKNGTDVKFIDGAATTLEEGDSLSISSSPMPEG